MSIWRRSAERYGETPEPVTPYQRAAQAWDDRIGSARVQAKNWRLMAFGSLGLAVGLSAALVWSSGQSRVTPYVIEVSTLGEVRAVGPADEAYVPSDAQIAFALAEFISDVRSVSIDPVVVRQNWLAAYDHATDRAAATLNEYARANDPFAEIGRRSVAVEVTSVVRAGPDSFTVRWTERAFLNGALQSTTRFTAVLSIVFETPRDAETLRKNPLGLYVHGLNWSQDLRAEDS